MEVLNLLVGVFQFQKLARDEDRSHELKRLLCYVEVCACVLFGGFAQSRVGLRGRQTPTTRWRNR
jgi:uncharacterized protein YgfB (UPF0149 family)